MSFAPDEGKQAHPLSEVLSGVSSSNMSPQFLRLLAKRLAGLIQPRGTTIGRRSTKRPTLRTMTQRITLANPPRLVEAACGNNDAGIRHIATKLVFVAVCLVAKPLHDVPNVTQCSPIRVKMLQGRGVSRLKVNAP
jgi:hypothetical protein